VPAGTVLPLSAVIITKDAAAQLGPCLASLDFADEILVVDSGSIDGTRALAASKGARVIEHAWLGFGPQKRFAVAQARNDWVLCVDADERVSPELRESIVRELASPRANVYEFPRRNRFMGRYLRHGEGYPDWSRRLFHREHAMWSDDAVHEQVLTSERIERLDGDLLHDSAESLARYMEKQDRYTTLQAERVIAAGERPSVVRMLASPLVRFVKFYVFRLGFLDGVPGLVHIAIGCRNSFQKYAKARAMAAARR
jgi:glycosyltransferase involved in cell wall biosynthesis